MVFSIRGWAGRLLFLALFAVLLFIAGGGYRWLVDAVSPVHPYQKPRGDALKVFVEDPPSPDSGSGTDRLRWFYWYGE